MFFLLRMAFWLSIVLILLPTGSSHQRSPASDVGASDVLTAASATVHDIKGFCTREPDACTVGSELATSMGYRARAGAKMLYDLLTEAMAQREADAPAADTGRPIPAKSPIERASQNTLTPADLGPAWRGPPVRKFVRHSA